MRKPPSTTPNKWLKDAILDHLIDNPGDTLTNMSVVFEVDRDNLKTAVDYLVRYGKVDKLVERRDSRERWSTGFLAAPNKYYIKGGIPS